jgi:16S rRNA (cytosine967-C5)-methyltransferase
MSSNCRAEAARVLAAVLDGASLNEPLAKAVESVPEADRALLQQLCYGTLRSYHRLQGILRQLLQKKLKRKDNDINALLLLGLYQLAEMRTPDHAAISTTVEACRVLKKHWATGLVNGILRRYTRESQALLSKLDNAETNSHPQWLLDEIARSWPAYTDSIIEANNTQPPMCLRVNAIGATAQAYEKQLTLAGVESQLCELSPVGIRLQSPVDIVRLPGFTEGLVSVQDEAAQLAAALLDAQPGQRILDACAAPGGKACHLLELVPGVAELVVMDVDAGRLHRVQENLERLKLPATLLQGDATRPPAALVGDRFDRILVDAPCSGSGVIRRHPDIKLLRRKEDIAQFADTQLAILKGLWPHLLHEGKLLYVTCSILPLENQSVIERFLAAESSARLQPLAVEWGVDCGGTRQLLPSTTGPDGMYFALLEKV